MIDLDATELRAVLNPQPCPAADGKTAAVAVVFRRGDEGTELLFIQRATKASDQWSGHMAFPGGRTDPADGDSRHTAERETLEEVSLDLNSATLLGSLDDLRPDQQRSGLAAIHAHCYWLAGDQPVLEPNYEVADTLWVPLASLADRNRFIDYYYLRSDSTWPGIQLDAPAQVVWGLTLRFLADLFERLNLPFLELTS